MLFLVVAMAGATGLFYYASATRNHGSVWVDQLCGQTALLCNRPHWLLIALSAVVIVGLFRTITRA